MSKVEKWMSWYGGVDVCALTPGASQPNLLVHVAAQVHTPAGSSPSGMVMYQPDPNASPTLFGFLSGDEKVGSYFGPNIFAGTPFENAPVMTGSIRITHNYANVAEAAIDFDNVSIQVKLDGLGELEPVQRQAGDMPPFAQQVLEAKAGIVEVVLNGTSLEITIPEIGISGGYGAVWSPAGIYSR